MDTYIHFEIVQNMLVTLLFRNHIVKYKGYLDKQDYKTINFYKIYKLYLHAPSHGSSNTSFTNPC